MEQPRGLSGSEELEGSGVFEGDGGEIDLLAGLPGYELTGLLQDRQVHQPQEVHLEQAQRGDGPHSELGHADALLVSLGAAHQRHDVDQGLVGNHDAGGVGTGVADNAFQAAAGIHEVAHHRVGLVGLGELRNALESAVDGPRHDLALVALAVAGGDHAGEAVDVAVGEAEGAARVAEGGLGAEGAEGDDLGHPVGPVAVDDVGDDLVPAIVLEVHVDVGHLLALDVEEALEDQPVLQRLHVGDSQAVKDDAGGGAAPDSEKDALPSGEAADVPDHEEIVGETGLTDDIELVLEAAAELVGDLRIPLLEALPAEARQVLLGRIAVGHREAGQVNPGEVDRQIAFVGDAPGVGGGAGEVRQQLFHLLGAAQVVGRAGHLEPVRLIDGRIGLNAEQHVLDLALVLVDVMDVVGADHRDAELVAHLEELPVDLDELGDVVVPLDFEVEVRHVVEPPRRLPGVLEPTLLDQAGHLAVEAAGEHDQAVAMLLEQLPVDSRPVVEALELGLGGELQQVLVAGLVLGEQRDMERLLIGGVSVVAAARRQVAFHANDGLDAFPAGDTVEVDRRVEDAVIGEADGVHPELLGALYQGLDAAKAVEETVFGMQMKVGEGLAHKSRVHLIPGPAFVPPGGAQGAGTGTYDRGIVAPPERRWEGIFVASSTDRELPDEGLGGRGGPAYGKWSSRRITGGGWPRSPAATAREAGVLIDTKGMADL